VAHGLGITAVPSMFVNEEKVFGSVTAKVLRETIDRALLKAGEMPLQSKQASTLEGQDLLDTK